MTKSTKNSVNVSVETLDVNGKYQYFKIYEVIGKKANGEKIVSERYLNIEDAEKEQELLKSCEGLYKVVYIMEQMVWVK